MKKTPKTTATLAERHGLKPMTIENLRADGACEPGMKFVVPLIEAGDPDLHEKLMQEREEWWLWAASRGYDVFNLTPETIAARGILIEPAGVNVDSDVLFVLGGTISAVWGGTISAVWGGTISEVLGGTISAVWGGTISAVWGGTISAVRGGTISKLAGNSTAVWYLFEPPSNVSEKAIVVHRKRDGSIVVIGVDIGSTRCEAS